MDMVYRKEKHTATDFAGLRDRVVETERGRGQRTGRFVHMMTPPPALQMGEGRAIIFFS